MSLFFAIATVVVVPVFLLAGAKVFSDKSARLVTLGLVALVALAVLRSAVTTRLDGFAGDEPFWITSGVSNVRTGDFRLGPEGCPLVKLWAGAALPEEVFELPSFVPLKDKADALSFSWGAVYTLNDPDVVQRRARMAMLALNALLLLSFALAVWRLLGPAAALGGLAFLVVDPTVAAHLPVVMMDLPESLASMTALLAAVLVFTEGRASDMLAAACALGAALGAKHSGLVAAVAVVVLGAVWSLAAAWRQGARAAGVQLVRTAVVSLGAVIALWGLFGFRFAASPGGREQFNMPLVENISHVGTPGFRSALVGLEGSHLLPQAYVWGLAAVTRTALEGRFSPVYFLGRSLIREAPFYYFPVILAVKLPLGLTLLALLGAASSLQRRRRDELRTVAVAVGFAVLFLAVLGSSGSAYAGIRHALPVVPALAVLAAVAVDRAWTERSRAWRGGVAAAFVGAAVSALPVMRPWEYYNELVGGPANAWRWFGDEGVDMELRTRETIRLYHELEAAGKRPYVIPDMVRALQEREGLPDAWESLERHMDESSTVTGTFLIWTARWLSPNPWYDLEAFRTAEPVDRRGNLLVFEGSFRLPWVHAIRAMVQADRAKQEGDLEAAERYYAKAVEFNPQWFPAAIELGNLRAKRGAREEAIRAFETALANAPAGEPIVEQLRRHLERLATEPLEEVAPLYNPDTDY